MSDIAPHRTVPGPPPPGTLAGVDEAMIETVVRAFYGKIRADEVLGPIFSAVIADWEPHLRKMCDFWSSILLMTKRYEGRPVPPHLKIEGLDRPHFERWLRLFDETTRDICPPAAAELFIDRAGRVAQSLLLAIDFQRGVLPPLKAPIRAG